MQKLLAKLSLPQRKAATTCDQDLVISAGAGAGKTRTLAARYLYLHLELGYGLEEIVAITFTNKAAAEMQERIRQELTALGQSPAGLDTAYISTFHSFCSRLLREFPAEVGLDPEFQVIDDLAASVRLYQAVKERINQGLHQEEADPDLLPVVLHLGEGVPSRVIPQLVQAYNLWQGSGLSWEELVTLSKQVQVTDLGLAQKRVADAIQELIALGPTVTSKSRGKVEEVASVWSEVEAAVTARDTTNYAAIINGCAALLAVGSSRAEKLVVAFQELEQALQNLQRLAADLYVQPVLTAFLHLLRDIHSLYTQAKRRENLLDFNDQILLARELFRSPKVQQILRQRFKAILVDEFQDTNSLQKELIDLIRPANSLTVVGDPQQSIYRFRGAEVEVFTQTAATVQAGTGSLCQLTENYRSRGEILAFCNQLFTKLFPSSSPYGVSYAQIKPKREQGQAPRVELLQGTAPSKSTVKENRQIEAQAVAYRIAEMVTKEECEYRDIAVLFRSTTDLEIYHQAFRRLDIPVVNLTKSDFFFRQEIINILAGLQALTDPCPELALATALRSPLFRLNDSELWRLKQEFGSLQQAVFGADDSAQDQGWSAGLARARQILGQLQPLANRVGPSFFVTQLLEETAYPQFLLTRSGGEQAYANLTMFQELTAELEAAGLVDLNSFLAYIAELLRGSGRQEEAQLATEDEDAVKLLTIHAAKGLEFKVVFVVDIDRSLKWGGFPPKLRFDQTDGFGLRFSLDGQWITTGKYQAIAERDQEADYEEAKRIFYVAVTRAKDYLVLSGIRRKESELEEINQASSWLQWLDYLADQCPGLWRRDIFAYLEAAVESRGEVATAGETDPKPARLRPTRYRVDWTQQLLSAGVSDLLLLNTCPRQFHYQRLLGLPQWPRVSTGLQDSPITSQPQVDPLLRGNLAHLACARLTPDQDLATLVLACAQELGLAASEHELLITEVQTLLATYRSSQLFTRLSSAQQVLSEEPFSFELARVCIRGTMDKLAFFPDGSGLLIDFKTNQIVAEQVQSCSAGYRLQLHLYAAAIQGIYGQRLSNLEVGIYFLVPGAYIELSLPPVEELAQTITRLRSYLVPGEIADYPQNQANCGFCSYTRYCLGQN